MKANVFEILRRHFPESEFALMQEVRNAAGYNATRSADYLAMNLWPSRGLAVHGIEAKASRSDWLRELKKPEKSEEIFKFCDYWWLLTTNDNVATMDEIPDTWGWIRIHNGRVKTMKQAPKLTPESMTRGFIASMLRRAVCKDGYVPIESIQDRINEARTVAEQQAERTYSSTASALKELRQRISDFEKYTGITIYDPSGWRNEPIEKIGSAVNFLVKHGQKIVVDDMIRLRNSASSIMDYVSRHIDQLTAEETAASNE